VVQQESAGPPAGDLALSDPLGSHEYAADVAAERAVAGMAVGEQPSAPAAAVQRQPQDSGQQGGSPPDLGIAEPGVIPNGGDVGIPHSDDTLNVQWVAANLGGSDSTAFGDRLHIYQVSTETMRCPGSDDELGSPIYDSDTDSEASLQEIPIPAGAISTQLMEIEVGPFPSGSYRFTVTVNSDNGDAAEVNHANNTTWNCINIEE
jgi:hypothetical protein